MEARLDRIDAVGRITLDYPERLNAIGPQMWSSLGDRLREVYSDDTLKCVVLTGAGRAFSAGGDISNLVKRPDTRTDRQLYAIIADTTRLILRGPKPVVAMVNGDAFGAGAALVAAADLALAVETARFGYPEIKIGMLSSITSISLIRSVPRKIAYRWALMGETFSAQQALEAGLVNEVVPAERLEEATGKITSRLSGLSPSSLAAAKSTLVHVQEMTYDEGVEFAKNEWLLVRQSHDSQEGLAAFMERREPVWTGA